MNIHRSGSLSSEFQKWETDMYAAYALVDPDEGPETYETYDEIRQRIINTPAQSLQDVAVKLRVLHYMEDGCYGMPEDSPKLVHSAIDDLERFAAIYGKEGEV